MVCGIENVSDNLPWMPVYADEKGGLHAAKPNVLVPAKTCLGRVLCEIQIAHSLDRRELCHAPHHPIANPGLHLHVPWGFDFENIPPKNINAERAYMNGMASQNSKGACDV